MLAIIIKIAQADDQVGGVVPHLVDGGIFILQYADDIVLFWNITWRRLKHEVATLCF